MGVAIVEIVLLLLVVIVICSVFYAKGKSKVQEQNPMTSCSACGNSISGKARICPKCGHPTRKNKIIWICVALIVIGFLLQLLARGC